MSLTHHQDLHNIIRGRFYDQVETVVAGLLGKVEYDNVKFTVPNGSTWVRWSVRPGASNQASIGCPGSNRHRSGGVAIAQVFATLETGDKNQMIIVDAIKKAFQAVTDQGVIFMTPSIAVVGRSDGWWQVNVTCPFQADEFA